MEINILNWIQSFANDFWDTFFIFYTRLGDHGEIWIAIIILLLLRKKTRIIGIIALISLITEFILVDTIIKPIVMRPRPFETTGFEILISKPRGSSFPSGHSASSFAVASVYFLSKLKGRYFILFAATVMAFSRVYLYVHYPSDVLAGSILGFIVGFVCWRLVLLKVKSQKNNDLQNNIS